MSEKPEPYRVLARKYRPQNFDELIGQDALVRTLKNAIESGRVAHAFMLTGVRGVGKTTTARIIAKALNYTGADGKAGPTTGATDDCPLCQAISEDRHPDVLEMDAATHTGVDDIREILDGVRYAPSEARYKIYIIDEVHMLSKQAFNALLKTLEEPPSHVKFIFATTEIRKVPITVLSRCQRFDLRRVEEQVLSAHYKNICAQEKTEVEDEAIAMISRAADGSVRDGLSLLDQAIALASDKIATNDVADMLGLADRAKSLDLLEKALTGDMPGALEIVDDLYAGGGDPAVVIQDLLDLTHMLTRLKAVPGAEELKQALSGEQLKRAKELADSLSMPTLGKTWQILLKGLGEVNIASNPQIAAEMVMIRLVYAADLPDPADLIKKLKDQPTTQSNQSAPSPSNAPTREPAREPAPVSMGGAAAASAPAPQHNTVPQTDAVSEKALNTLEDIVALLEEGQEILLAGYVYQHVHLIKLEQGRLEINLEPEAPPKLAQDLGQRLSTLSGQRWIVSVSGARGQSTLAQIGQAAQQKEFEDVLKLPVIQDILEVFPDAILKDIKTKEQKQ